MFQGTCHLLLHSHSDSSFARTRLGRCRGCRHTGGEAGDDAASRVHKIVRATVTGIGTVGSVHGRGHTLRSSGGDDAKNASWRSNRVVESESGSCPLLSWLMMGVVRWALIVGFSNNLWIGRGVQEAFLYTRHIVPVARPVLGPTQNDVMALNNSAPLPDLQVRLLQMSRGARIGARWGAEISASERADQVLVQT